MKAGDLLTPILLQDIGLEETSANNVKRVKTQTGAMQVFTTPDFMPLVDQVVKSSDFLLVQPHRQT